MRRQRKVLERRDTIYAAMKKAFHRSSSVSIFGIKKHAIYVLDQDGVIIDERTITNYRESLRRLSPKYPEAQKKRTLFQRLHGGIHSHCPPVLLKPSGKSLVFDPMMFAKFGATQRIFLIGSQQRLTVLCGFVSTLLMQSILACQDRFERRIY
jgi:hypothetical protein